MGPAEAHVFKCSACGKWCNTRNVELTLCPSCEMGKPKKRIKPPELKIGQLVLLFEEDHKANPHFIGYVRVKTIRPVTFVYWNSDPQTPKSFPHKGEDIIGARQ